VKPRLRTQVSGWPGLPHTSWAVTNNCRVLVDSYVVSMRYKTKTKNVDWEVCGIIPSVRRKP